MQSFGIISLNFGTIIEEQYLIVALLSPEGIISSFPKESIASPLNLDRSKYSKEV